MTHKRRDFLRTLGKLGAASMVSIPATALGKVAETGMADAHTSSDEKPGKFTVHIYQTTDVHCQLHPHDELFWENGQAVFRKTGGYGPLHTYFEKQRKKHEHSFFLDTGDMFQGSELSVKTLGKALVPILNTLNYDLYLPGNWEVIYYKKAMQTLLGSLHGPKVCANMYHDLGEGKKGEFIFPPYHIWTVNGVKIGFLGYTDPLVPLRQSPNYSKGIIYTKPEENLAHYVDVLRNQEQCAYVIMIAHLGLSQQIHLGNLPECKGVDYILGGDTHERVRTPIQCTYTKVVEPGAFGSFVGRLDLTIEKGRIVEDVYELVEINAGQYKNSREMEKLIQEHEAPFQKDILQVVGYSTIPLYRYFVMENPIDTMVLEALHWKLPDVDIVLSNGFRFCPPRTTPDHTGHIPITNGFIYDMLPVDSTVRTGYVTGQQIMDWLEKELNNVFAKNASERFGGWLIKFKGMHVKFHAFGTKGSRVQEVQVAGKPLDTKARYKLCACERDGDPVDVLCRMKNVADAQNTAFTLHSVMRDYLKTNSPVTPRPEGNAMALDAPQTLLTQVSGVDYQFR